MNQPNVSIGFVKNLIRKEINMMYSDTYKYIKNGMFSDVCLKMLDEGSTKLLVTLSKANSWDELNDFIWYAGYNMSLQDWLNSYQDSEDEND